MPELFALTSDDVSRLRSLLQQVGSLSPAAPRQLSTRRRMEPARIVVGALDSAAAATTALLGKPKVATLSVYSFSSTGVTDTLRDETVYNFASQAATTDRWTVAERDSLTGKWIITTQFCS